MTRINALADVSNADLLAGVETHQNAQKRFPPHTVQWKLASLSLCYLFKELARREADAAGTVPLMNTVPRPAAILAAAQATTINTEVQS